MTGNRHRKRVSAFYRYPLYFTSLFRRQQYLPIFSRTVIVFDYNGFVYSTFVEKNSTIVRVHAVNHFFIVNITPKTIYLKAVTACCRNRFILIIALFDSAVSPALANRRHFQRRNLVRHIAAGGIWSRWNCQQQIAVHFILIIALCNPAVLLILAERSHFQRRNLKQHIAARLAVEGFGVVYFFA